MYIRNKCVRYSKEVSLLAELERQVQNIEDVFQVVSILIELLDLGQGQTEVLLPDDACESDRGKF